MELHAEMLKVKMEVIQVVPQRCRPLSRWKKKMVVMIVISIPWPVMTMRYWGLHHGVFEVPNMEADDGEQRDDFQAQVKRVKATPHPNFEQTCHDIGTGRFSHKQLVEIAQLACLHSETRSGVTPS